VSDQQLIGAETIGPSLVVAEYSALREEIVKRKEIQYQLVTLALLVAGAFLTVGLQLGSPSGTLLVYPLLAVFIAGSWAQMDLRIGQLGEYIREKIEPLLPSHLGWETYLVAYPKLSRFGLVRSLSAFSARGVFITTQLIAIALAVLRSPFLATPSRLLPVAMNAEVAVDELLFVASLLSVICTAVLLRRERKHRRR
jgi:hypothetical protein